MTRHAVNARLKPAPVAVVAALSMLLPGQPTPGGKNFHLGAEVRLSLP